jgi:hypothetical protein
MSATHNDGNFLQEIIFVMISETRSSTIETNFLN